VPGGEISDLKANVLGGTRRGFESSREIRVGQATARSRDVSGFGACKDVMGAEEVADGSVFSIYNAGIFEEYLLDISMLVNRGDGSVKEFTEVSIFDGGVGDLQGGISSDVAAMVNFQAFFDESMCF